MIDLTKEFNNLIENEHDIILVRHNTHVHCKCWRRGTATPDPNCPNCLGEGFIFVEYIKKCKIFKLDPSTLRVYFRIDKDTYANTNAIKNGDTLFEIWVDPAGVNLKDPKLGDNILRRKKWEIFNTVVLRSENNRSHFIKTEAKLLPSAR